MEEHFKVIRDRKIIIYSYPQAAISKPIIER